MTMPAPGSDPSAGSSEGEAHRLIAQGLVLFRNGQLTDAAALYERVLDRWPNQPVALHLLGLICQQLKQHDRAVELIAKSISVTPDAIACSNRGISLRELKRFDEALASYDQAIALKVDFAQAHYNRGNVLKEVGRLDEALASYDRAVALKPDYASAYNNRGNVLRQLGRLKEALASHARAIALQPDRPGPHSDRGHALYELRQFDEALADCDRAIALEPGHAEAYSNRGLVLQELGRLGEALASHDEAIALRANYAETHSNRGRTLEELGRFDEAFASYGKALALKPDFEFLFGTFLLTKKQICDWTGLEESLAQYRQDICSSKKVTRPFAAAVLIDSAALQRKASEIFSEPGRPSARPRFAARVRRDTIRIGYFSADFHDHATSHLMAGLFENSDTAKFELYGFSFGPHEQDEMRKRVSAAFAAFHDVASLADSEVARFSRDLGIDIAIDLKGYTQHSRPGIFAERCAPVQVNYLGYPGTMGTEHIDYIIADTTVIPRDRQADYTEKVVYLPNSYQVTDSRRRISDRVFTRQELGLPEQGFVFCCFNNSYKISPPTFDIWMRLLRFVEGSVLWLLLDNPTAASNLRKEAEKRGVDSARLVFAMRTGSEEHLARHRLADLFLDTLPCNAHTTASDALWAGLPVLTCMRQSFASRVAASLLRAIGLPELITRTEAEYEALAIELAKDANVLSAIRRKLERNRRSTPLFDTRLFARHIEAAYSAMHERRLAGLAPESIEIADHEARS